MYFNRHKMFRLAVLCFSLFAWTICEIVVIQKQKDEIYSGHVLFELSMPMWSLCAQFCSRVEVCKSINFIASNKTCQINNAEPGESECGLIESEGNSFIGASTFPQKLAGQCEGNDCKRNEACMPRGPEYYCVPLPITLSKCSTPSSDLRPRDCSDLPQGICSGVYTIYPADKKFDVYCDMDTAGFGWTVFQNRINGKVDFYRGWNDYKIGFGNLTSEFWLGNDFINVLTSSGNYKLYIHLEECEGNYRYAEYSEFSVGDATTMYTLNVTGYSGDAGDRLKYHNGMMFSTNDKDNDLSDRYICAQGTKGAWWYKNCYHSNLNGKYTVHQSSSLKKTIWGAWIKYSVKSAKMMIKRN